MNLELKTISPIFRQALQQLDCNCNNCAYMERDMGKFQKSLIFHDNLQTQQFNNRKAKLIEKAEIWSKRGEVNKSSRLLYEADKMRYQFDKGGIVINYGLCKKYNKAVSFIPDTLQIDTQHCFLHRNKIIK